MVLVGWLFCAAMLAGVPSPLAIRHSTRGANPSQCGGPAFHNRTCLPRGAVLQQLPNLDVSDCCSRCVEVQACVSWNVNHEQKLCFLRTDWLPVSSGSCTAGLVRKVPQPPPMPPAPPPMPPPPPPAPAPKGAKNVLFLVSDDMRPELGTYGSTHIHSPNLDALAEDGGMVFERAYVMISLCMPSRTAFLTSRRPDTTKNWVIGKEYWRATGGPNATTLPQHFKQSGFRTVGMGKVFHGAEFPWTGGEGPLSSGAWDGHFSFSEESFPYFNCELL